MSKSSHVFMVNYDKDKLQLEVTFHNGKTYLYHNVTPNEHHKLIHAPSLGEHLHEHIKPFKKYTKSN